MTNQADIYEAIEEIFDDVFFDGGFTFSESLSSEDIPQWDSLAHIRLLTTIEEQFSVRFDIEQIADLKSVERLLSALTEKLGSQ